MLKPESLKQPKRLKRTELERVTVRFAGDSGDGIQTVGGQFGTTAAIVGNDLATLPDIPAEIRAPAGSLPGVSGFQISFSSKDIHTAGDEPDVLVALNPAALRVNIGDLSHGTTIIVNEDTFTPINLKKAGYTSNPLEDGSLKAFRLIPLPITKNNAAALKDLNLSSRVVERCKNFYALGIMYWLYDRPLEPTLRWIKHKFGKKEQVVAANQQSLKAGYNFANTIELFTDAYFVRPAKLPPGRYRNITGNEATALGFIAASQQAKTPLFYASYPITPASDILHELARHKNFGVMTMQAEDEIASIGAAIGASFGGWMALTGTSGPGLALKSESIGLAVAAELPLVIANVQRAGPSTGMPTKTEQADLLQAMFGRNGESPVAIVAPSSPGDCFIMAIEAFRIAIEFMTPVIFLSDGYLANGAEPWLIPSIDDLPKISVRYETDPEDFQPYKRDPRTLARPWAIPGTPNLEHRIGGLAKADITGHVSYDPVNNMRMVKLRAEKIERIADTIPDIKAEGPGEGDLLVLGWGSTYGAITSACGNLRRKDVLVSNAQLRYINPFPKNLGRLLKRFDRILIPELNLGQLNLLIRARFMRDTVGLSKVMGKPFGVAEIETAVLDLLEKKGEA